MGIACTDMKHAVKNPVAVSIGSIRTKKKASASRENGKLGGRPKSRIGALAALKAMQGILKKPMPDPVVWQRQIRQEWDDAVAEKWKHAMAKSP